MSSANDMLEKLQKQIVEAAKLGKEIEQNENIR